MHKSLSRILACAAFMTAAPATAQDASVKAGVEAWQRGDHAAAVSIWRLLADKGDADASFNLGQAYRLGQGVNLDLAAAQSLFDRAARLGHLDAQTSLGLLLFQNGNRVAAMRWLKAAAERGEPRALLVYGTALFNGDDVPRDPVRAYAYVSRAAAQGLAPARETLAQMDDLIPLSERQKGVAVAVAAAKAPTAPAPKAKVAPDRPAALASMSGGWRVQLGAFSQRSAANALFRKLAVNAPLTGKQSYLVAAGAVTRLQAGPFESRAAATTACATLSARGQPCFAVAPR